MKRLTSLVTVAALARSLVGAATNAQASSTLYMVPISPLNATYAPGDVVRFAAVVDLNNSSFASLSIPFAAAWVDTEFGGASGSQNSIYNGTAPYVDGQPTQKDPNNPHTTVFNRYAQGYTTTYSKINGNIVYTIQNTVGQLADVRGGATLAFPAGTYTLGTFSFPISANNISGSATIYMPTPYGFSNSANAADGAYSIGAGPLYTIIGRGVFGNDISEPILFPAPNTTPTNGKYSSLTYRVAPPNSNGEIYGLINLGLAPNASPQPITLVATSYTTHQSQTFTVPIGPILNSSQSNFDVYLAPDSYDVTIQGSKWLKQRFRGIRAYTTLTAAGYAANINTFLIGGDANGDNSVDSSDFGILIGAYGSDASILGSGYDPTADFNCDGVVDATDFGILIGAYGEVGAL